MKAQNETPAWDGDQVVEVDGIGWVPACQCMLWWQRRGLSETASGYGSALRSTWMVKVHGRWRRVRVTIWSNAGSSWVMVGGKRCAVGAHVGSVRWSQVQAAGVVS